MAVLSRSKIALFGVLVALALPGPRGAFAEAQEQLTQEQALRRAFPEPARIERRTAYLDDAQIARARELAGRDVEIAASVLTYYVGLEGDRPIGIAYFDSHRVRTLPEVLMIVVGADDRMRRVEVVRWSEPPEFRPSTGWLNQFLGRALDAELSERRGIAGITGATLTTRAATRATRRVLALHQVIDPLGAASR